MLCDYLSGNEIQQLHSLIMTPETSISDTSKASDFREAELRERPPTPIDWENNILDGLDVLVSGFNQQKST
jgi:hypothetical protein